MKLSQRYCKNSDIVVVTPYRLENTYRRYEDINALNFRVNALQQNALHGLIDHKYDGTKMLEYSVIIFQSTRHNIPENESS